MEFRNLPKLVFRLKGASVFFEWKNRVLGNKIIRYGRMSRWKLGSMVGIKGLFHPTYKWGIPLGYNGITHWSDHLLIRSLPSPDIQDVHIWVRKLNGTQDASFIPGSTLHPCCSLWECRKDDEVGGCTKQPGGSIYIILGISWVFTVSGVYKNWLNIWNIWKK